MTDPGTTEGAAATPRPHPTPGAPRPHPGGETPHVAVPDVAARLDGFDDLSLDLRIRTLAGIEADLRSAVEATRR